MKLLVIEDEEKINTALKQGFSEEGFETDSVLDGEEALKILEQKIYDCIVLDLMLPKKDGITILQEMRKVNDMTPVIILTARDEIQDKVHGLGIGADDYLAKPFSFDELLARVKAVIRRSSTNQEILQVDTLVFDPYKKSVTRSGIPIHITGKDLILLEYLMKHKGSVLSEQSIMSYVWGYNDEIESNVVASHIKNLRIKIDKAFPKEKKLITTLRDLGYKIDG